MEHYQFFTLVGMLAAGFGWLIHKIGDLQTRMAVVETVLQMMGAPTKYKKKQTEEEEN